MGWIRGAARHTLNLRLESLPMAIANGLWACPMGCNRVVASEGYGPRLQRTFHREEFIAYLLAV